MRINNKVIMNMNTLDLIDINKKVLKKYERTNNIKVYVGTIPKNLDLIIPKINSVGNSGNRKEDLIEKATYIMSVISWAQPFLDGNRRTGVVTAFKFLYDNGYKLDIDPEDKNLELRRMLSEIKKHIKTLNQDIIKQISFYIKKRIKPL